MCGSYGVRLVHYIANRTTAKYEKKSSKEICYQGQLERLVLEYGELLGLFYWYLPEAVRPNDSKVQCYMWCTATGDLPGLFSFLFRCKISLHQGEESRNNSR